MVLWGWFQHLSEEANDASFCQRYILTGFTTRPQRAVLVINDHRSKTNGGQSKLMYFVVMKTIEVPGCLVNMSCPRTSKICTFINFSRYYSTHEFWNNSEIFWIIVRPEMNSQQCVQCVIKLVVFTKCLCPSLHYQVHFTPTGCWILSTKLKNKEKRYRRK